MLAAIRLDSCPKVEGLKYPFFGYFASLNNDNKLVVVFFLKNIGASVLSDKSMK
jgi:hypothetical protein